MKKFLVLLSIVFVTFNFIACDNNTKGPDDNDKVETSEPEENIPVDEAHEAIVVPEATEEVPSELIGYFDQFEIFTPSSQILTAWTYDKEGKFLFKVTDNNKCNVFELGEIGDMGFQMLKAGSRLETDGSEYIKIDDKVYQYDGPDSELIKEEVSYLTGVVKTSYSIKREEGTVTFEESNKTYDVIYEEIDDGNAIKETTYLEPPYNGVTSFSYYETTNPSERIMEVVGGEYEGVYIIK